jgi:hypothetical protein
MLLNLIDTKIEKWETSIKVNNTYKKEDGQKLKDQLYKEFIFDLKDIRNVIITKNN